jgi:uncharacterized protein YbjT (DUF2867 family)
MFTVMGITGQVGGAVARSLLAQNLPVRAVLRDPSKAQAWRDRGVEIALADATDVAALTRAFTDTEAVFVMIPPNFAPAPGFPETHAVLDAIEQALNAARPARAVHLSSIGAQHDHGLGLIGQLYLLEQQLGRVPIAHAFLRPGWFIENSVWDVTPAREKGIIDSYLQPVERAVPMVATEDIGRIAAEVLQQQWKGTRVVEIEGPVRVSPLDIAATFSDLLGHPVGLNVISPELWEATFVAQGTPLDRTANRIEMIAGFNSGWIDFAGPPAEHRRGATTLREALKPLVS